MRCGSRTKYIWNQSHAPSQRNQLVQYIHSQRSHDLSALSQPVPNVFCQLSGSIDTDEQTFPSLLQRLVVSLTEGNGVDMPDGAYCGSVITPTAVWLFKTASSNDTLFYVREPERLRWSTDPSDLVGGEQLDHDALVQCCAGEDIFAYRGVERVAAGTIVETIQKRVLVYLSFPVCEINTLYIVVEGLLHWLFAAQHPGLTALSPWALRHCSVLLSMSNRGKRQPDRLHLVF